MFPVKLIYLVFAGNTGVGRQVGTHRSLGHMQRELRLLRCLMTTATLMNTAHPQLMS